MMSSMLHRGARLAGACALAFAACVVPVVAQAQFVGDTGNDLNQAGQQPTTRSTTGQSRESDPDTQDVDVDPMGDDSSAPRRTDTDTGTANNGARDTSTPPRDRTPQAEPRDTSRPPPYVPGEFERYVQKQVRMPRGQEIKRFGANLVAETLRTSDIQDPLPAVPGDYVVRPGDEISLTLWGAADANLRLTVDRSGRIAVPRVGAINVAGLKNADLDAALRQRIGQTYRNFDVTATLGRVRAIRVFVSGYAQRPGSITVNGLASVLHAIMRAGGPSAAGSFRDIHLRRGGKEVALFDLYDLLLKGDRNADQLVQPDDVIFIGPVGAQVALVGSVNQQAIYELKPGEALGDLLRMAGGFNSVADRTHVAVERLADRLTGRVTELPLPGSEATPLGAGDLVRVFSIVMAQIPLGNQNKRVHVDGEVVHPGDYVLPPNSTIGDALRAAGGMTQAAYPYGTEFSRESVRQAQRVNYERALRDLETDLAKRAATTRATSPEEVAASNNSSVANTRLLERLRRIEPSGRVVLRIEPDSHSLPDLALEDGDRLTIPARGTSVGVFGSVFNTGSFYYEPGHTTQDYLSLAGGPTRGADKESMFLIRANGSVVSALEGSSFWHSSDAFQSARIEPGDTIFVPEELDKSTFVQNAKDWTQILYQFGLGVAGIAALSH